MPFKPSQKTTDAEVAALLQLQSTLKQVGAIKLSEYEKKLWRNLARPEQLPPPGDWNYFVLIGGRGSGKTRPGAEFHKEEVIAGRATRAAIIAPTAADLRDVVVEGESGILAVWKNEEKQPVYEKTNRRVVFPNGSLAFLYSAEEPERLRGPQHDFFWFDEMAAARYHQETWDMLMFGLRLGKFPRGIVTTTPKPIKLLQELIKAPNSVVRYQSTYANRANLPAVFFDAIITKYEGTRLGRQELDGELLEETPDSLWKRSTLDACRIESAPAMRRIVVSIDPAVSDDSESNETGIVVIGIGFDNKIYVLWDASMRGRPEEWAQEAIYCYNWARADGIIAETNQGGDMVESTLRAIDANVPFRKIHASRGKVTRAEPVSALYERGRVHHVKAFNGEKTDLRTLENQMVQMTVSLGYTDRGSPDHLDAMVHGVTELALRPTPSTIAFLPEFATVKHLVNETPLAYWLNRWISVALGPSSAAHWYAQEGRQVRIYRDLTMDNATAELVGERIAEATEDDLKHLKIVNVWLDKKHFDSAIGNKSVARQLADGIDRVLGRQSAFVWAHEGAELHVVDENRRMFLLQTRAKETKEHRITLMSAQDEPAAGWEHLRNLLRPKNEPGPALEWNRDFALDLKGKPGGADLYQAYVDAVMASGSQGQKDEAPGLVLFRGCVATARAVSALSRDEKLPDAPLLMGENGALAASLLAGMMAHRQSTQREPLEEFVSRRLTSVKERRGELTPDIAYQVESKAKADYARSQPKALELRHLPRRRIA